MSSAPTSLEDRALADEILRGSVRSRSRQARVAFMAMIINTGFVLALLGRGLDVRALAGWLVATTSLLVVRYIVGRRATASLNEGRPALLRCDRQFRALSLATQTVCGAGIWIAYTSADPVAPYMMTLLICLYATGTMINLAHDHRSVKFSMPLLMGQPILFWLINGAEGIAVAVMLIGLTLMLISSAGNSQASFDESIRIRFEKDDLLKQLEHEKRIVTTALQDAEAANRSKSFFMAAASHDLRQPLYAATILHDALALHELEPAAAKLVEQQGKALRVAGDLFDNLLDLSRFESGVIKPVLTEVHLAPVLRELDAEFLPQCEAKGLWLRVQANDITVISDYDLLTRTLRNLLSNAIRYTATGGIVLASCERGAHALVSVRDTGIGIAPDDRDRIFKEFVQIDNPQRSRDRGVGLGLAIVRHIAVLLGHEVQLESTPGAGTEMSIRMPRSERAHAAADPKQDELATETELAGMKVWIVEDDDLVREALSAYFMKLGCLHRVACSRADLEALERQDGWPDFVILDDMLGGEETGLDLARWLAGRMGAERLLLTTGNADAVRWQELNESGFSVARKPLSASMLQGWLGARLRKV